MTDQCPGFIELEHGGGRVAALLCRRRVGGGAHLCPRVQRVGAAMDDPDVISRIDRNAGDRPEQPVVRERLRPQRIDLEARRGRLRCNGRRGLRVWALAIPTIACQASVAAQAHADQRERAGPSENVSNHTHHRTVAVRLQLILRAK